MLDFVSLVSPCLISHSLSSRPDWSHTRSTEPLRSLSPTDPLLSGLCRWWHICVSGFFLIPPIHGRTRIYFPSLYNCERECRKCRDGQCLRRRVPFPLQPDLVRNAVFSWWRARLSAPLCPGLSFLPLLHCRPGRSLGLRWSTSRLWKQTKHVCFLQTCFCVAEFTAGVGQPAPAYASTSKLNDVGKWTLFNECFSHGCNKWIIKASPSARLQLWV